MGRHKGAGKAMSDYLKAVTAPASGEILARWLGVNCVEASQARNACRPLLPADEPHRFRIKKT